MVSEGNFVLPNSSFINQPIQEGATFVFPILTFCLSDHSSFKDDPLERSLHDSVISSSCATKKHMCADRHQEICKTWGSGNVYRSFLYQTMLLLCGHPMQVITVGLPHLC